MIQRLFAAALLAGACSAYPHQDESTIAALPESLVNPENPVDPLNRPVDTEGVAINPEQGPVLPDRFPADPVKRPFDPERGPLDPEKGPVDPDRTPFPVQNAPVDARENLPISQDGPKSDSDLKTDATFWPYYRSNWGHPTYRTYSYWSYPTYYRYYRPRTYSYYYW